jgi:cytidylate kinase
MVIAIDGPGGAGKSTVSRALASQLGFAYVDTGAMYRVIGVLAAERGIGVDDATALAQLCDATRIDFVERDGRGVVEVDGRDLSAAIRTAGAAQDASRYSTVPAVRERLVARQRELGAADDVVMEGRDIGTVVFPEAQLKVYLDASPRERARRRAAELGSASDAEIDRMAREIAERDERDRGRAHSPLRPAEDAILLDSTDLPIDRVVAQLLAKVAERRVSLAR